MKAVLLFVFVIISTCSIAQTMKQRLVAEVFYGPDSTGNFIAQDSAHFFYSGQRHSEFDYNRLCYLPYLPSDVSASFWGIGPAMNNIDSTYFSLRMAFDSLITYKYESFLDEPLHIERTEACSYHPNGTPDVLMQWHHRRDNTVSDSFKQIVSYVGGQISKMYYINLSNRSPDTDMARIFIRNASGQVITDSSSASIANRKIAPRQRTFYTYDAAGRYTVKREHNDLSPFYDEQWSYTYYPDNKVRTILYEREYGTDTLFRAYLDSFGYTPGVAGYTYRARADYDASGNLLPGVGSVYTSHVDGNNRKDFTTETAFGYGTPIVVSTAVFYNSYGNPETMISYDFSTGFAVPFEQFFYYYELYDATVQVTNPLVVSSSISLSPNPVSSALTLHYITSIPKERLHVAISNTAGQLVHSEDFIPQGAKTDMLLGDELTPGLYAIAVYGSSNAILYKGTFLKQ